MSTLWLNVLASGILIGIVYGLIALGLTIIFGVMRVVNFAHGEMVVTGIYIGYLAAKFAGLSTLPSAALAGCIMFVFGYLLQVFIIHRFVASPPQLQFIVFIGVALLITGMQLVVFGPDPRSAGSQLAFQVMTVGPVRLDLARLQAALTAGCLIALLGAYLRYSTFGRFVRAAADNRLGGLIVGLNIPRIYAVTAGIGTACAGVAGALVSPIFEAQPYLAVDFTLLAFVAVIVGGLGSFAGALVAGVLIGVVESVAALLFAPSLKTALSYAILIVVLLLRPRGLFGVKD
jgi:branched-chain amino acid transport system permease protein